MMAYQVSGPKRRCPKNLEMEASWNENRKFAPSKKGMVGLEDASFP